ncbi:MAG: hypothetical protein C3F13_11045 [Anaerolineales bacterium]|nr:hypothetical protein [Anaerolineae bacterium]PWB52671.1 MAG: hypothetical protein C3F13_11045 [Anaerolineales bacterium]
MHQRHIYRKILLLTFLAIDFLILFSDSHFILAKTNPASNNLIYLPLLSKPYPTAPANGLLIAYSSQMTGELKQYNVDTGAVTQLLPDHFMSEGCNKFSPDIIHPKLLYLLQNPASGDLEVKIKDLFGGNNIITLPNSYRNSCSMYWYPNGSAFAIRNLNTDVYDLLSPDGTKLTSFWGDLGWKLAFSPDGNRAVFVSPFRSNVLRFFTILKDGNGNIIGLNQDPSDFVTVDIGDHFIADIEWSPEGTTLAILIENNWDLEDADLLLIEPNGTVVANLTNGFNRQAGKQQNYWEIQWSPAGKNIAFWVYNLVGDTYVNPQVYVINIYTKRIIELTGDEFQTGETPAFSPDGNKLIFTAGPQFGRTIVMCNPDGSDKISLPIENSAFNAIFRP